MSVRDDVVAILQDVFDDPNMEILDDMTADDVELWDSLEHINIIIASENQFSIKFTTAEMSRLKEPGQNIGSFVGLIESKIGQ